MLQLLTCMLLVLVFVYSLEVGTRLMQSGNYRNALIIGSEKMTDLVDWQDRGTCVLFGDGAGAAVLSQSAASRVGVLDCILKADGSRPEVLYAPSGGSVEPFSEQSLSDRSQFMKMNGKEIFKVAVRHMAEASEQILSRNGMSFDDVDCIVPHQANTRIIESLAKVCEYAQRKSFN